jgi:hypothetical protein
MSELLELVFNFFLELICDDFMEWADVRFYLPFLISIAIVIVAEWRDSVGILPMLFSPGVLLAGAVTGVLWQMCGDRKPTGSKRGGSGRARRGRF